MSSSGLGISMNKEFLGFFFFHTTVSSEDQTCKCHSMFEIRETIDGKQFSLVFPTGPNDMFSLEAPSDLLT